MTTLTHDVRRSRVSGGLAFAMVSAASFGLSGTFARGLLDAGWTAGAATLARVAVASLVLAVPAIVAMRGRWHILRRAWGMVVAYGVFAVAGAQLFYFLAVGRLDVGVALLIEYMAPVLVVGWMWARHRHRPGALTLMGAAVAVLGMALLLGLLRGAITVDAVGVGFALLAMIGAAVYFIIGGDTTTGLPPVMLAWGGLLVGTVGLAVAALVGVVPFAVTAAEVRLLPFAMPWWGAVLMLGVVSAAIAYVTGIAATRRLGARLGAFVALTEVIAAATFAWLLLGQVPAPLQLAGAALILAGVILVKLGEPRSETTAIATQTVPDVVPDVVPDALIEAEARREGEPGAAPAPVPTA